MKLYGLIGYPLSHSFSKKYFTQKFENEGKSNEIYENYPIDNITKLETVIKENSDLIGLNVTIPYKEQVLIYLDSIHDEAREISAANTIKIIRNKNDILLSGYNTDVYGFKQSLLPNLKPHHTHALILGSGGASKAIKYVLESLNIRFMTVSRKPKGRNCIAYQDIDNYILETYNVIINTTPLGTYPGVEEYPDIPYECVGKQHLLFDLVYNPPLTAFLNNGKKNGAKTINGLEMLHLQAEKSYEIWNSI